MGRITLPVRMKPKRPISTAQTIVIQSVIFSLFGPRMACSIWPPSSGRMGSRLSSGPDEADAHEGEEKITGVRFESREVGEAVPDREAEGDLQQGSCGGDRKGLGAAEAHAAVLGDAAEGLQNDRAVSAEFSCRKGMTQLVDEDRNEASEHEQQGLENRRG